MGQDSTVADAAASSAEVRRIREEATARGWNRTLQKAPNLSPGSPSAAVKKRTKLQSAYKTRFIREEHATLLGKEVKCAAEKAEELRARLEALGEEKKALLSALEHHAPNAVWEEIFGFDFPHNASMKELFHLLDRKEAEWLEEFLNPKYPMEREKLLAHISACTLPIDSYDGGASLPFSEDIDVGFVERDPLPISLSIITSKANAPDTLLAADAAPSVEIRASMIQEAEIDVRTLAV